MVIAGITIVAAVGVSAWWWWQNTDHLKELGKASYLEGQRAGAVLDETGCVTKAIAQHSDKENKTLLESVRTNVFLRGCLDASKADVKFCAGVPLKDGLLPLATSLAQSCANQGTDSYCGPLLSQISEYCPSQNRTSKL